MKKVKIDLDKLTKRFLLNEGKVNPTVRAYAETVINILEQIAPRSQRECRKISVAKQHLYEIKKMNRKLEEKINLLEEQIKLLEEGI